MEIEICAVGGYAEVGKNMSAVRIGDDVIIIDMGVSIPALSANEREEGNTRHLSSEQLIKIGAIPDDRAIADLKGKVKGIFLGHAHYDHIASVQFLAAKYKCPVYGTPFTIEVLRSILEDEDVKLPNPLKKVQPGGTVKVNENIQVEFIPISHSTLQCSMVCVHTPEGLILYGNDFKFDDDPILGDKPDYERLKQIGKSGKLIALIVETINAEVEGKTPSERHARELMKKILEEINNNTSAIFITTFSSQMARIKSAIEFGKKTKRKIVLVGRSMAKFSGAAEHINLVHFSKDAEIVSYGSHRRRLLKTINSNREKYIVITTGSQGEAGSVLDKIVHGLLPFTFKAGDVVIFACRTIPEETNIIQREKLESILKAAKVRIFTDVHSSGHASKEDLKNLLLMVKPKVVIPSQGDLNMENAFADMAKTVGYKKGSTLKFLNDGERLKL